MYAVPDAIAFQVEVPGEGYYRDLISCQVARPVHADTRGYMRAIAAGDFDEAYPIARGVNMPAAIMMAYPPNGLFMNRFSIQKGEGIEFHLLALALAICVIARGAGAFSLDHLLWRRPGTK